MPARVYDETRKIQKPPPDDIKHAKELNKWLHDGKVKYVPCGVCGYLCPSEIYGVKDAHLTCLETLAGKRFIKLQKKTEKEIKLADRPSLL